MKPGFVTLWSIVLLLGVFSASGARSQAAGSAFLMDSSVSYAWINSSWQPVAANSYQHNSIGRLIASRFIVPVNDKWTAVRQYDYAYDSIGNQSEKKSSYLDANAGWVNYALTISAFNENRKKTSLLPKRRIDNNGPWRLSENRDFEYDAGGRLISELVRIWRDTAFYDNFKFENFYDTKDRIMQTLAYRYNSGWELLRRTVCQYNDLNHTQTINTQLSQSGQWVDSDRQVIKSDTSGNTTETLLFAPVAGLLKESAKIIYAYDNKGRLTQEATQYIVNSRPLNLYRTLTAYDESGNVSEETEQQWIDNKWVNESRTVYKYRKSVSATD